MEIKTLTTLEELESLGSALTMEGLAEDSISEFIDWIKQYTPMKSETAYIIKGKTMNDVYMLTGNNKYPDDCTIVSIKLEDMENSMAVVMPRFIDLCYPEYVKAGIADSRGKDYIPEANAKDLMYEAEKQLIEYGIDIIPDEFGEKETLRKAVQMIKYRDKVLDLVLRLESGEVENYAENN